MSHEVVRDHLFVLLHGLHGEPGDLRHVQTGLETHFPSAIACNIQSNYHWTHLVTHDGVDNGGRRAAEEVMTFMKQHPQLKYISVVGHSLGGLYGRYMLGVLYRGGLLVDPSTPQEEGEEEEDEPKGQRASKKRLMSIDEEQEEDVEGLQHNGQDKDKENERVQSLHVTPTGLPKLIPVAYIALASPMMGSRQHSRVFNVGDSVADFVVSTMLQRTGKHLMLLDDDGDGGTPLLDAMSNPASELKCYQALTMFKKRTVFANVCYDFSVHYCTAALLPTNPFKGIPLEQIPRMKECPIVIDTEAFLESKISTNSNTITSTTTATTTNTLSIMIPDTPVSPVSPSSPASWPFSSLSPSPSSPSPSSPSPSPPSSPFSVKSLPSYFRAETPQSRALRRMLLHLTGEGQYEVTDTVSSSISVSNSVSPSTSTSTSSSPSPIPELKHPNAEESEVQKSVARYSFSARISSSSSSSDHLKCSISSPHDSSVSPSCSSSAANSAASPSASPSSRPLFAAANSANQRKKALPPPPLRLSLTPSQPQVQLQSQQHSLTPTPSQLRSEFKGEVLSLTTPSFYRERSVSAPPSRPFQGSRTPSQGMLGMQWRRVNVVGQGLRAHSEVAYRQDLIAYLMSLLKEDLMAHVQS